MYHSDSFTTDAPEVTRGSLRVYLGAAPGFGKTYAMLREGHRLKAEGRDVVVGLWNPTAGSTPSASSATWK